VSLSISRRGVRRIRLLQAGAEYFNKKRLEAQILFKYENASKSDGNGGYTEEWSRLLR
jgi:hypothetical protein